MVDQLEDTYTKYADAQDCMENNAADVAFLEEQIAKLQAKLTAKMDEIDKLETDMLDCQAIIVQGHDHILGLGIRYYTNISLYRLIIKINVMVLL